MLSIALLLHVDLDVFRRLVEAIGVRGQDYVLDWLVSRRRPERRPTMQLLFPKTYARLRDAIQAPHNLTSPLLRSFLANWYEWYESLEVWYEGHLGPGGGGFTGYWCWEAAAAAYALGLDDTELHAMRYYPKDLADHALTRTPKRRWPAPAKPWPRRA